MSWEKIDPCIRKLVYFGGIPLLIALFLRPGWIWYPIIFALLYFVYKYTDLYYLLNQVPFDISELKKAMGELETTKN